MLDNLYENIGGKIKNWAKWIFIIEAIGAIITGLILLFTDEDLILYGLLTLVCAPIVAYVGSLILYAFGELVEDVHAIRNKEETTKEVEAKREDERHIEKNIEIKTNETDDTFKKSEEVVPFYHEKRKYFECPVCGCKVKKGQKQCLCFSVLDWSKYE